jgi:hypothetical protein
MKQKLTGSKVTFKEAMAKVLPPEIINRGMWGFALAFGTWFKPGE